MARPDVSTRRLVVGTGLNVGGGVVGQLVELATVAISLGRVGVGPYGVIVLAMSLSQWPMLLEAGPGQAVARHCAMDGSDDEARASIVPTAVALYLVLGTFGLALGLVASHFILPLLIPLAADKRGHATRAFDLIVLGSAVRIGSGFITRILLGHTRLAALRIVDLARVSVTLAVVATFAGRGPAGLFGVGLALLAGDLVAAGIGMRLVHGLELISPLCASREGVRHLWSTSKPLLVTNAVSVVWHRVDPLIVSIGLGPAALTVFGIAFRAFDMLRAGSELLGIGILPATARLLSESHPERAARLVRRALTYVATIVWPLAIVLFLFPEEIARLWLRREVDGLSPAMRTAMVLVVAMVPGIVAGPVVVAGDRVRQVMRVQVAAAPLNFAVGVLLIRQVGVSAVFLGTIVGTLFVTRRYLREASTLMRTSPRSMLGGLARPSVLCVALLLVLLAVRQATQHRPVPVLASGIALAGAFYAVAAFCWCVPAPDRQRVMRIVRLSR